MSVADHDRDFSVCEGLDVSCGVLGHLVDDFAAVHNPFDAVFPTATGLRLRGDPHCGRLVAEPLVHGRFVGPGRLYLAV